MTTDQLIELLAANLKPVDRGRIERALILALAIGAAAAFGVMLLLLGPRDEMFGSKNPIFLLIKLLFTLGVVAMEAVFFPQFARPGAEGRNFLTFVSLPFIAIVALAAVALASSHWFTWGGMIVGKEWLTCLISIPLFAVVPFAAIIWALGGADGSKTRRRSRWPCCRRLKRDGLCAPLRR